MSIIEAASSIGRDVPERCGDWLMRNETAAEALKRTQFGPGREVFGFNQGTFSLIDLIDAVVDHTGPAHCTIATWTAAKAEMGHVFEWLEQRRLASARWLVDRSFLNRQPALCAELRTRFGDGNIRVARCHAKFVLLAGEAMEATLITSMNLNKNARIENYVVSACPQLYAEYDALVGRIFEGQTAAAGFGEYAAVTAAMDAVAEGGRRKQKRKATVARPW